MTDPGDKYKKVVTAEEEIAYQAITIAYFALRLNRKVYDELLAAEQEMHNVGHIINPTLYRDMIYSKRFQRNIKAVRAAVAFLDELKDIVEEMNKGSNKGE